MSDTQKDKKIIAYKTNDETFKAKFGPFLRNEHHTFVVQKTEKLASALYVVTGFVPDEDPLRTRLRTCALELVSTATDPVCAREMHYERGFSSRCLEIGTILNLGLRAGFLSEMNASILSGEYADLAAFVKEHRDKVFSNAPFESSEESVKALFGKDVVIPPKSLKDKKQNNGKTDSKGHENKRTQSKRHLSRRQAILCLLDKKDKISIKDAVKSIEGCSEKTIQRELVSMVQEGVLLKEGERRWSVYRRA